MNSLNTESGAGTVVKFTVLQEPDYKFQKNKDFL